MIIPIRCMNCGKLISDKWLYYQQELLKRNKDQNKETPHYMDATTVPERHEKNLLDELKLTRSCCRKHFLTQIDLMDKI